MIDHKRAPYGEFLTKNQILYPGLFPSQGLKPVYDREHVWNLIIDMLHYGFHVDAFTETEGGRWLPGCYLHALQNTDSIEGWALGYRDKLSLWSLTKVHSIRFADPAGHVIEWDNINGIRRDLRQSPALEQILIKNERNFKKHGGLRPRQYLNIESKRDDNLEVEFTIESYGHGGNGWDDPGEAAEVTIWRVAVDIFEDSRIELDIHNPRLTKFYEQVEEKIVEHVHEMSYDSYEDDY